VTLGKGVTFAECLLIHSARKISLCRVPTGQHSAKDPSAGPSVSFFAECSMWHSARVSLPSARATTLGKEAIPVPRYWYFAECYDPDTRQSTYLPSVTLGKVTSTHLLNLFFLFHPNKQKIHHIYHHRHKYPYTSSQHKQYQHKFRSINTSSEVSTHKSQALT
jgi:hypothetical protein